MPLTYTSNLPDLLARFEAVREDFPANLAAANARIETAMLSAARESYGARLGSAKYWDFEETNVPGAGMLASVKFYTDHPYVYGYEYGTRPHMIYPRMAKALRFTPTGGSEAIFSAYVNHPGTPAHNKRDQMQEALAAAAEHAWRDAIDTVLAGLTSGSG